MFMRAPLRLTLCLCSVVLFVGCARGGRQAALPLDPLTAEEEQTVVQAALADPGVKQLLGEGRHRVIGIEFLSLKAADAPTTGGEPGLAGPTGRHAQVLLYRPEGDFGVRALVDVQARRVAQATRVEGSRVPLTEDDITEARDLAFRNDEVRGLLGPPIQEFQVEGLRSTGTGPQDACLRNRCVHLLFRRGGLYLVTPAVIVDLTTRTVRVERRPQ
jgi:hypothetical protein